ncbi:ATP-binding cassette domain-containing protein [Halomonas nitroreducens]|uniref:ABC transporter ATP-binding protein n=1 Tax=Halomonas nitroreducens TaxID=447425 RepID=A0A431V778_9GAMM|nr:ATP-binding cassette domain-containing protein [Halomonas nitroreducens]RTR05923.1 ABC transporter ATP-binding protein [Halomonas nitroreducens]
MAGAPALVFEGVSKTFEAGGARVPAVDCLDISVPAGKVSGLIGPDGAGKTTLMRLAAGLLLPDEGVIRVLGVDVLAKPLVVQSSIGYMPQRFGLYEDLTVQENLDFYADLQGVPPTQRDPRYRELMHMTGLAPFTRRLAGRLSGGMKQKLGLACTLVRPPRLLLLDEATVGVDPVSRRELWAIVYRQVRDHGMTVLLSTAYLDEASRCEEIILLHQGRRLGQGSPGSFSEPLRGRTFRVAAPSLGKRRLQTRLSHVPGILDAIIEGERVRLVTAEAGPVDLEARLPDVPDLTMEAAEPVFEDAFIATLKRSEESSPAPLAGASPGPESPGTTGQPMIEVRNLQRRFGDFFAVRGVTFRVGRGEVFGLLGANGAGKTTTFRMLCGLLPVSDGTVRVAGLDLRRAASRARGRLGYMAQRFSLYENLTVVENLRFFASAYGLNRARRTQRIGWALEAFELGGYADSPSGELPLGYKQRLAMAAALMHEPDILFLDEPTSGVDPLARREFWQRINALAESGVTVLVTTHFMDEANYCDRLVIMADGEVLTEGSPAQMKARFRSAERPDPTMEDAFIGLIEQHDQQQEAAS